MQEGDRSRCSSLHRLTVRLPHVHTFVELTEYMTASGKVGPA